MANERIDAPVRSWQTKETVAFLLFLIATLLLTYLTIAFANPAIIGSNYIALISVGVAAGALALIGGIFLAWSVFSKSGKGDYDFRELCAQDSNKMFLLLFFALTTGLLAAIVMPLAFSSYLGAELLTTTSIASAPLAVLISGPIIGMLLVLGSSFGFYIYTNRPNLAAIHPDVASTSAALDKLHEQKSILNNQIAPQQNQYFKENFTTQAKLIKDAETEIKRPHSDLSSYNKLLGIAKQALQTMENAKKTLPSYMEGFDTTGLMDKMIKKAKADVLRLEEMRSTFQINASSSQGSSLPIVAASSSQASSLSSAVTPSSADQPANTTSRSPT